MLDKRARSIPVFNLKNVTTINKAMKCLQIISVTQVKDCFKVTKQLLI